MVRGVLLSILTPLEKKRRCMDCIRAGVGSVTKSLLRGVGGEEKRHALTNLSSPDHREPFKHFIGGVW